MVKLGVSKTTGSYSKDTSTPAYAYQIPLEGGERVVRQSSEPCQVVWNLDSDVKAVKLREGRRVKKRYEPKRRVH